MTTSSNKYKRFMLDPQTNEDYNSAKAGAPRMKEKSGKRRLNNTVMN